MSRLPSAAEGHTFRLDHVTSLNRTVILLRRFRSTVDVDHAGNLTGRRELCDENTLVSRR